MTNDYPTYFSTMSFSMLDSLHQKPMLTNNQQVNLAHGDNSKTACNELSSINKSQKVHNKEKETIQKNPAYGRHRIF